jgi:hypothetical protein
MDIVPMEGMQAVSSLMSSPLTHFAVAANTKEYNKVELMRTSVIIAMVMLLKAHLKTLYSLSEESVDHAFFLSLKFSYLEFMLANVTNLRSERKARSATKRQRNDMSTQYRGAGCHLLLHLCSPWPMLMYKKQEYVKYPFTIGA